MSFGLCVLVSLLTLTNSAQAQQDVFGVQVVGSLTGTLYIAGVPADTGTVTLHRVSPEEASSLDSIQVGPGGAFEFNLPNLPIPGSGEVFFAATRYDGIVYPGVMITDPAQLDEEYRVDGYSTRRVSGDLAFGVSRREMYLMEGPRGWQVLDVLEIANPDSVTLVPEAGAAVWRYPLPETALAPRLIQMGPVQGQVEFEGSTLVASNPVVPAQNYYLIQYDLESIEFDLPMPGSTGLAQLMYDTPMDAEGVSSGPELRVEGLARTDPGQVEFGANAAYWVGQDLLNQTVRIRLGTGSGTDPAVWIWLAVALTLCTVGAGTLIARRGAPAPTKKRLRRDVLVDLARLDEVYGSIDASDEEARAQYADRRGALVRELAEVDARGGPGGT